MPEHEYVRVKDKSTGHKFSVIASAVDPDAYQVLKQDAVDHVGDPLPPEFNESLSSKSTTSGHSADSSEESTNG